VCPLRRFAQDAWPYTTRRRTVPASPEVALTYRVFAESRWHPYRLGAPLSPFRLSTLGLRVLARLGARPVFTNAGNPLMDLRPSSESSRLRAAIAPSALRRARPSRRHPPVRSLAPSASPRTGQRHQMTGLSTTRSPAPTGFLNLLAPRSAPCLVALFHATSAHGVAPFRALFLSCSRTPSPAPLPSCRSSEPGFPFPKDWDPRAPPPSGVCSARESASHRQWIRLATSTWLSWA
jgi:hypothetical protein